MFVRVVRQVKVSSDWLREERVFLICCPFTTECLCGAFVLIRHYIKGQYNLFVMLL